MSDICPVCGLPKELCTCDELDKEKPIRVYTERARYRRLVTIIEGIEDGEKIVKQLKSKLACGGTYKDKKIILQGDHKRRLKKILEEMGYTNIEIE